MPWVRKNNSLRGGLGNNGGGGLNRVNSDGRGVISHSKGGWGNGEEEEASFRFQFVLNF